MNTEAWLAGTTLFRRITGVLPIARRAVGTSEGTTMVRFGGNLGDVRFLKVGEGGSLCIVGCLPA